MGWIDDLLSQQRSLSGGPVVSDGEAIPSGPGPIPLAPAHLVTGNPMAPPFPEGTEEIVLAAGCFWGVEKRLWQLDGVWTTAVGYAGGWTVDPTYEQVCSGRTGHTEAVRVVFDPAVLPVERLLATFFEMHDPTQGMRQGNDRGSQYRSAVYATTPGQLETARRIAAGYQERLAAEGLGEITTEFGMLDEVRGGRFFPAEDYHQQYLLKNPNGYCNAGPNGLTCPVGALLEDDVPSQHQE